MTKTGEGPLASIVSHASSPDHRREAHRARRIESIADIVARRADARKIPLGGSAGRHSLEPGSDRGFPIHVLGVTGNASTFSVADRSLDFSPRSVIVHDAPEKRNDERGGLSRS